MYKNVVSLTLLLLLLSPVFSQNYRNTPATGARWKIQAQYADPFDPCYLWENYYLYTDGQTMIGPHLVTKVYGSSGELCSTNGTCWGLSLARLHGYIYQDSAGRVYEVEANGAMHAMYDYALQPGDTLNDDQTVRGWLNYRVDSVDTVTFIDNIPRRRLFVSCSSCLSTFGQAVWVEGIGDLYHGPLPQAELENVYNNLCYKEDSTVLATVNVQLVICTSPCDLLIGTTPRAETQWSVAPNPTAGAWTIFSGSPILGEVTARICNLEGKVIWAGSFATGDPIVIDLGPSVPSGLYLVNLVTPDGQRSRLRLMHE